MNIVRPFLSADAKLLYDQLKDDTLWWRCDRLLLWVEDREMPELNIRGDELLASISYSMEVMMLRFPPDTQNTPALWHASGISVYEQKSSPLRLTVLDKTLLYYRVKRRVYREKNDKKLQLYRSLRDQVVPEDG